MFFFTYYSLSLFIGGLVALGSGLLVFLSNSKQLKSIIWLLLSISTGIWSFGYYSMLIASSKEAAVLSDIILHIGASFIPFFYLFFIITVIEELKKYKPFLFVFGIIAIYFASVTPSVLFVTDVFSKGTLPYVPNAGPLYVAFTVYFFATVIFALILLSLKIKKVSKEEGHRLKYILFSSVAGFIGGSSVFLLTFNVLIPPFPVILFAFYPLIIAYAILKYKLFDIRVITAQLLTATIWITLLFRVVLAQSFEDAIIGGVILVLTVIFGIWLVKNVFNEIEQRERIQKLADDLEKANTRLTELDRQKSEFVSFATHQLRAPLTAMKGYGSLLLEGDMGELPPAAKEGIERIFDSTNTLVSIVNDYLNISRIELGTMKYTFETIDLKLMVEDVIAELKPNIEGKGLNFSFAAENNGTDYRITADRDKLKQVIANLVDNSVKYTPSGSVAVTLSFDHKRQVIIFEIKDTGIGIDPEILPHLFQKFSRANNANKVNIKGTGLGLFVAKQMVEAHHGTIRAESAGEGKGATFVVELEPFRKA